MASIKKSSERWRRPRESTEASSVAFTRPGNRAQRHGTPAKNKETQAGLQTNERLLYKSGNDRKTSKWYERLDALLGHRPSFSGTASTFDSGTMVWEAAQTADSVANDDDHDEGKINYMHWGFNLHNNGLRCTLICSVDQASHASHNRLTPAPS